MLPLIYYYSRLRMFSRSWSGSGHSGPLLLVLICFCSASPGCERKQEAISPPPAPPRAPASKKLDVCSLLKADEVSDLQGSPIKQVKSSAFSNGQFLVSQCYYETSDPSQSVNLALTVKDPNSKTGLSPREFWERKFAPQAAGEAEEKPKDEGEAEEERHPPSKIAGVGDDAYWMGRDALYVLRGDAYLRLSIGGPDSTETKIEKARKLIAPALVRLSASNQPAK